MKLKIIITAIWIIIIIIAVNYFKYLNQTQNTTLQTQKNNTLIVGTSDDYPPYTFSNNGIVQGFDIDLCNAIAQQMNKKIIIKTMSFDVLLLELMAGSIDIIAAGMSPTAERAKKVLFSQIYSQGDPLLIIACKEIPLATTVTELFNKKVIVNEGYSADFYLQNFPQINVQRVELIAEGLLALQKKRADYFITAQSAIQPFFATHKNTQFIYTLLPDITETYAFALAKNNIKLCNKINNAIDILRANGILQSLKQKWNIA